MDYKIVDSIWDELGRALVTDNFIIVTDNNIYDAYRDEIKNLLGNGDNIYVISAGEESKSFEELFKIYELLIQKNIDRKGKVYCLGGGVVGDLGGFAAATYKRGIDYIQIPTSLLAQVDSSIGGKTGIDFLEYKNMIGSFHFPLITYIDTSFINTLPKREISCGLGEIIKYGFIQDYDFLKYVEKNIERIYRRDMRILQNIIRRSIEIKSAIVEEDKLDNGIRQNLNFGHTIGHSIESFFKYKKYNHGESVILGMIYESDIAYKKGLIEKEYCDEIKGILDPLVSKPSFSTEDVQILMAYMKNDKKNKEGKISFILPTGRGKVQLFHDIDESFIVKSLIKDYDFDKIGV